MKALVIVLLMAGTASARVVMTPTIPRSCPRAARWDDVTKCLTRFGKPKVARDLRNAKLVVLSDGAPGVYLYVRDGEWRIAGMYEISGEPIAFQRVTINKHVGYRFDLGMSLDSDIAINEDESRPAVTQLKVSVFCSGASYRCTPVVTSCDVFVDGSSRETYRGKLRFVGDVVKNVGDRKRVREQCATPEEQSLFWND
jgi:hypothetical protein